jgi:hypothetical protein
VGKFKSKQARLPGRGVMVGSLDVDGHNYQFIRCPHPYNQHVKIMHWQPAGCEAVQEVSKTCSRVALKKNEALNDDKDVATAIRRFNLPRRVAAKAAATASEGSDGSSTAHRLKERPALPSQSAFEKPNSNRKQQYLKRLINYTRAQSKAAQLLNHIPNADIITTKLGIIETMRAHATSELEADENAQCKSPDIRHATATLLQAFPFMPETYRLDRREECLAVLARHKQLVEAGVGAGGTDPLLWILKPTSGTCGKGIRLLAGETELTEAVAEACGAAMDTADVGSEDNAVGQGATREGSAREERARRLKASRAAEAVVQRYLCRPLLLQGRKFDVRCFCLVARTAPAWLLYFHKGCVGAIIVRLPIRLLACAYCSDTHASHLRSMHWTRPQTPLSDTCT